MIKPKVFNKRDDYPQDSIYIGRGSKWGNPFVIGKDGTRFEVIEKYRNLILPFLDVSELKNKNLVCYCKPKACHGDLLLEKANSITIDEIF